MTTLQKVEALFDASHVKGSTGESEKTMDRLIWGAWRAFWIGLGASAVLIAQSMMSAPSHDAHDTARLSPAQVTTASATANVTHVYLRPAS